MNEKFRRAVIIGLRFVQLISVAGFIFGAMWSSADTLRLTLPQFMMLYGLFGIVVPEGAIRGLNHIKPVEPRKFRK